MTTNNPKAGHSLEDAVIELYLDVKVRTNDEVNSIILTSMQIAAFNEEKYEEEKKSLKAADPFAIIDYIRSSVEVLMNLKVEEDQKSPTGESSAQKSEVQNPDSLNGYEAMLQKLEEEIRNHVRVEQQLKLQIETILFKKDSYEHLKHELKAKEQEHKEVCN